MSAMRFARPSIVVGAVVVATAMLLAALPAAVLAAPNAAPPSATAKIVFVHHSTGSAWLQDGYGGLASALGANNYFVSDTNYGWGPGAIGDSTDIGHWWTWFRGPVGDHLHDGALRQSQEINSSYARSLANPGGENTIVMFKSCFPNSAVGGSPADAVPAIGSNPLRGTSGPLTVGNAKGVYLDLLEYFKTRPDKLFVLIVSPPLRSADTNASQAANARVPRQLAHRSERLPQAATPQATSSSSTTTPCSTGGHHRIVGGAVEHSAGATNYLAFPTGDSHPSAAGDQVATSEFVPMLNAAYNSWKAGTAVPGMTPVYRFYNKKNGSHFYTASGTERNTVLSTLSATYSLDGVAYSVNTLNAANNAPLYRFFNKKNGSHFYTASLAEKNSVQGNLSATYSYDGPAYNVCITPAGGLADGLPLLQQEERQPLLHRLRSREEHRARHALGDLRARRSGVLRSAVGLGVANLVASAAVSRLSAVPGAATRLEPYSLVRDASRMDAAAR